MRIHTLGTSHGDSTFCRFNSSTAYETADGTVYLVDAGEPAEALLRRQRLLIKDVKAVFITHMHGDHAGGLDGVMREVVKYPQGRAYPLEIYLPEEPAVSALKGWFKAIHEDADSEWLSYKTVNDGEIYDDEQLTVTAVRTQHLRTCGRLNGTPCSFAYILHFKKEDLTVLHTGDLRGDFADFPCISAERHFDVCLCEATHYQPEDSMPYLMRAKFDKLIFIHIGDRWHSEISSGWMLRDGERELLDCCRDLPYPVLVAHDGDTFWF